MTDLNNAVWRNEPGWLQKKRQLASILMERFPQQTGQEQWLKAWSSQTKVVNRGTNLVSHDGDYVVQPLSKAVNEYSEMLQENLMEKAISWQDGQLNAAHLARIDGGQFVYVPDDVVLNDPIVIAPTMPGTNPHNVIIVGAHSRVVIDETAQFINPGAVYAGTELLVGTEAQVTYRQFNRFVGRRARQAVHCYQAQGSWVKLRYGQGSATDVTNSLYSFLDGRQTRWTAKVALRVPAGAHQECRPILDGYGVETVGRLQVWGQADTAADLQLAHLTTGSGEPLNIAQHQERLTLNEDLSTRLPAGSWLKNKFTDA